MWRRSAIRLISSLHLDRVAQRLEGRSLLVLMYHYFCDEAEEPDPLVVARESFREQMLHLSQSFNVVKLSEGLRCLRERGELPEPSIAITVDDVGVDFERYAWPVLQELGVPVTLAVCPGFMDGANKPMLFGILHAHLRDRPDVADGLCKILDLPSLTYPQAYESLYGLDVDALGLCLDRLGLPCPYNGTLPGSVRLPVASFKSLRDLVSSGLVEVGSHTMTHPDMRRVSGEWLRWELWESYRRIMAEFGECPLFFYPGGAMTNPPALGRELLKELGYEYGFLAKPDFVDSGKDVQALGRVAVIGGEDASGFRFRAGGWPALARRWYT